ncbi:MAG TPA: DUF983 domain-containing protein [Acetobacteraceae bacterium]|nr:DUF983 domain-containing protein [Acetobacteraceae bacterium]
MPDQNSFRWQRNGSVTETAALTPWPNPPFLTQVRRGLAGRCPACGQGPLFAGYLRVVPTCVHCGAPLGELRSDDAPPYVTILIVGHIVIGLLLIMETDFSPPLWLEAAILMPLTLVLTLALLRPVKGATVGMMLRLGMIKPPQ